MSIKILMVCLGNICRSPLAQGILESKLSKDQFVVDSAGTGSWHVGHSPDFRSIEIAKQKGLSIEKQKGRQFVVDDFDTFDYIYVMDNSNYKNVISLAKKEEHRKKVKLIMDEIFLGEKIDVPDPYFGMNNGFAIVYDMLDEVCTVIANKLKKSNV